MTEKDHASEASEAKEKASVAFAGPFAIAIVAATLMLAFTIGNESESTNTPQSTTESVQEKSSIQTGCPTTTKVMIDRLTNERRRLHIEISRLHPSDAQERHELRNQVREVEKNLDTLEDECP